MSDPEIVSNNAQPELRLDNEKLNHPINLEQWDVRRWEGAKPPPPATWTRQRSENLRAASSYKTKRRRGELVPRSECASGAELTRLMNAGSAYPYPLLQRIGKHAMPTKMKWTWTGLHASVLGYLITGHLSLGKKGVIASHANIGEAHFIDRGARRIGTIVRELCAWGLVVVLQPTFRKACVSCKALFAAELRACPCCRAPASAKRRWRGANCYAVTEFAATVFRIHVAGYGAGDLASLASADERPAAPRSPGKELPSREESSLREHSSGEHAARHPEISGTPTHVGVQSSTVPGVVSPPSGRTAAAIAGDARSRLASQARADASSDGSVSRGATTPALASSAPPTRELAERKIGDALRAPAFGRHDPGCSPARPCRACVDRDGRRRAEDAARRRRARDEEVIAERERELVIEGPKDLAGAGDDRANPPVAPPRRKTDDEELAEVLERANRSFGRGKDPGPVVAALIDKIRRGGS